jgi:Bacterial TniB protein
MSMYDNNDPAAYLRALLDPKEADRVERIENVKTAYMTSGRDDDLIRLLKRLTTNAVIRQDPSKPHAANNRAPGKGLCIIAPPGAGKSRLLNENLRDHAAFPNWGEKGKWCPLVAIAAPAPSTLGQLGIRMLELMEYDGIQRDLRENKIWLRVRQQLRLNNVLFVWIDDLNNVLHVSSEEEIQKIRDTIKDLLSNPEWPVQLIISGTKDLLPFFRLDRQVRRRFRFMWLGKLTPKEDKDFLKGAIEHYAKEGKLMLGETLADDLVGRLLHSAVYEMGLSLETLAEACEEAIERNSRALEMVDFANAFASRNFLPDDQNPFIIDAWHVIDTSRLQRKEEEDVDDTVTPLGQKRAKGKNK